MKPQISVIMLTYNREQYVGRAIESILNQNFDDYELILVDNGSTDRSGEICDDYRTKDSRIKVLHRSKGNIGSGRNAGLNLAQGNYIAFVDDDDICKIDYLQFLYYLAIENKSDIAICGTIGKECEEKYVMNSEQAIIELLKRRLYNAGFPTKLIRSSLFDSYRFPEKGNYDDIYLMPQIISDANRVTYYGLGKYIVIRHDNNNSSWTTNHRLLNASILNEYLDVYHKRTIWLHKKYPSETEYWQYFEWSFMISMIEKIHKYKLSDCNILLCTMHRELIKHHNEFLNSPHIQKIEKEWMIKYVLS